MRLNKSSSGIVFQVQEVLVICGTMSYSLWGNSGFGITLVSLGIIGAVCRTAFNIAEKQKFAEAKQVESEKIKDATSALSEAFSGFGRNSAKDD
ncbi:hypothetical protein OAA09_00135 [bacterium]|nr:hypothetical protein [bacterium]